MINQTDKTLLRWGSLSTYLLVIAFIALLVGSRAFGMREWVLWVPLFSVIICLWVCLLLAAHNYLKQFHNALTTIGSAFGALLIVVLFAEVAAWSADKMLPPANDGGAISPLFALFYTTHSLAIWFHALWLTFWGAVLARRDGREKTIGRMFFAFAGCYAVYYMLVRLGLPEEGEWAHSAGHIALILSHWMLAGVLLGASKEQSGLSDFDPSPPVNTG